jgi:hypothetical protein
MKYADAKAMWESAKDKIRGKQFQRRSRADARIVKTNRGFGLRIYSTLIVEWLPNGNVVIDNGGFKTPTTRDWINAALHNFPYKGWCMQISQKDFDWYMGGYRPDPKQEYGIIRRADVPFHRHMVLTKRGRILPAPKERNLTNMFRRGKIRA